MSSDLGLRERKKLQTRQLIADTARQLFAERGFEQVSVAEVARAADVSEATVFNYFPTKEDLVYSGLERFENELLDAVRDRPPGESIATAIGRFFLEPRGLLAADPQAVARLIEIYRMISDSPALLARERQILDRYTTSLTQLIAEQTNAAAGDLRPSVAAAALVGLHRALIEHVRRHLLAGDDDPGHLARSSRSAGKKALALLEHGLADYGVDQARIR
jgi:AcrR family transcriptional regulator